MKKIFLFIVTFVAMVFVVSTVSSIADTKKNRDDLVSFNKIYVKNTAVELDVKIGKEFSVVLKGGEGRLEELILKVDDGVLVIMEEKDDEDGFHMDDEVKVVVVMPAFNGLEVNGAVDADIEGIKGGDIVFDINGAANIEIEGQCDNLEVDMKGAGNFEGRSLKCENVDMSIKGAGNADVYASHSIVAEVRGIGNIDVYGKPEKIKKHESLLSNIEIH